MDLKTYLKTHAVRPGSREERDAFFKIVLANGLEVLDMNSDWTRWAGYSMSRNQDFVQGVNSFFIESYDLIHVTFQYFLYNWGDDVETAADQDFSVMEVLL